jgi:hypothetical protein
LSQPEKFDSETAWFTSSAGKIDIFRAEGRFYKNYGAGQVKRMAGELGKFLDTV